MDEILNNLYENDILHTTSRGVNYNFISRTNNGGVKYSINQYSKILPLETINNAFLSFINGVEINANWYKNFNQQEYKNRPCNLSVLKKLLNRIN